MRNWIEYHTQTLQLFLLMLVGDHFQRLTKDGRHWWCSVRPRGNVCPAVVSQKGDSFTAEQRARNHPPKPTAIKPKKNPAHKATAMKQKKKKKVSPSVHSDSGKK